MSAIVKLWFPAIFLFGLYFHDRYIKASTWPPQGHPSTTQMNLFLLSSTALLALLSATKYLFTDVAVYGLDRCIAEGVGPVTDILGASSPLRQSVDFDQRLLATGSVRINKRNELIISNKSGALVGLVHGKKLLFPDNLINDDHQIDPRSRSDYFMAEAKSNDLVVIYVPHSTRLTEITNARFYKAFNGRAEMSSKQLVEHFVGKFVNKDDATSRRFTLIVARVRKAEDAIQRRLEIVAGPDSNQASDDAIDAPLSFFAQPTGNVPTQLPAHLVSQGVAVKPNTQQTQVYSNNQQSGSRFQTQPQSNNMFQTRF